MTAALPALVGALGLAALLLAENARVRLAGLLAVAVGVAGLAVYLVDTGRLVRDAEHRPALAAAGLLVAAVAFLGGTWLLRRVPWLLAYAALVAAPIRVPVHVGGQEAALLVPLYGVVACAWLALALECLQGVRQRVVGPAVGLPLALLVAFASLSLAWSADTHQGAVDVLFFLLPFGVLLVALARLPLRLDALRGLLRVEVVLALAFAAVAAYQQLTHTYVWDNPKLIVSNLYSSFWRASSVFYDPSVYGRFLAVAIVLLCAALVLGGRDGRGAAAGSLVAGLLFGGLVLSYSQSSFAALGVGLVCLLALVHGRRVVLAVACAVLVVAAVAVATPPLRAFRQDVRQGNLSSVTSTRSGLVGSGLRLFAHHPLDGVGYGGFVAAARPRQNAEARAAKGASHTMPVTVAAELGLPGLTLLVWWLVALGRIAVDRRRSLADTRADRLVLGLGLLVILVHSLFYAAFFEDPLTFGMAALLVVAARGQARRSPMVGAA